MTQIINNQIPMSLSHISAICFIRIVSFIASKTGIIVAFFTQKSIKACYVIYHQSAVYIFFIYPLIFLTIYIIIIQVIY